MVITMLPNSPQVKAVVCGENGFLPCAKEGLIYIDMSSIAPLASKEVAAECAKKGVRMLEARCPAESPGHRRTLSIMCGGDENCLTSVSRS